MENHQACVWATSRELWDSFLNDPELLSAIDSVRSGETAHDGSTPKAASELPVEQSEDENEKQHRIGARLRAYETPITDEILRQSIR